MSSASRTTTRGGKGGKPETTVGGKSQKSDAKSDSPKALDLNPKIQPTAEQMRIAQIIDTRTEDPDLKDKIKQVMDATRKTEDEVCTALHDCDNDPDRAVNMLLEGMGTGEWEMSGKKKKNRQPGTNAKPEGPVNNREDPGGDWSREREGGGGGSGGVERERSRVRGGGPPRMRGRGSLDSRGWRGRENKENEKNLEDSRGDIPRRGGRMMNGPGGRSGRGGRGGRLGPRTFQNRERGGFPRSIDTWNNPQAEDSTADPIKMGQLGVSMTPNSLLENWADDFPSPEDWDNEEYTGSLADTKVFTPSNSVQQASLNPEPLQDSTNQDIASPVPQNISSSLSPNSDQMSQNLDLASTLQQNNQTSTVTPNTIGVGVMTPAQSQYLSQLTQATESLKSAVGIGSNSTPVSNSSQTYGPVSSTSTNNYPVTSSAAYHTPSPTAFTSTTDALSASFSTSSFGGSAASYSSQMKVQASVPPPVSQSSVTQSMPARTKTQRPRVPPPSKIPSTAVEMPGDAINSNICYLDVQFGGLEFGSETSSFDFSTDQSKFSGAATGTSMDSVSNSGTSSAIDLNASNTSKSQSTSLDGYSGSSSQQSSKDHNQSGMSLGQNQKLSGPENIPFPSNQNAEHKTSQPAFSQPRVSGSGSSGVDIGKSDAGLSYSASSTVTYQNSYQNQKASATVYQAPSSYSTSSGYTSSQVQSSSTPYPSSQAQSSFSQSQSNSGYVSQATNSSYPSSQASNSAPSYSSAQSVVGGNAVSGSSGASSSGTGSGSYASSQPSVPSSSSYQNSGSQAVPAPPVSSSSAATSSAYQGAGSTASTPSAPSGPPSSFPSSMSQSASANSYPSQSTYQSAGQSGYANSSSLGQSSGSSGGYTSSSAGQYQNSYGSSSVATSQSHSALHTSGTGGSKIGSSLNSASKEPQFETTTTSSSNLSSTIPATTSSTLSTNVNVSPALGLPTSSQTVNVSNSSSTKVSSSTGKTGGLPNIPPGAPPIMGTHQYIMSQAGLPYFAGVQQPVFSYEDLQLLQQRIPHMAAGYYDLGYQTPTSLATGREGGLASVAYSVSDGRFARTDNNSSPVPSTLSQQNPSQAHQQPMLNPTALPPGYAYFYGGGMVPAGGFQYGTPAIYPMPTATNAHGATNNTQYPKPGSYGSAYGSGYDNLSQNQEYGKTGYVSGNQSQSKGGVGGNTGTAGSSASDLGATMYGKSHVVLGKSYDKQGFHSGTPPPFNMAGTQTTPMGAPSGAYPPHLFIPTMAPHQQHHSTTLMHQPLHTMEMRNPGRRSESGSTSGQRSQSSNQPNKSGGKQGYSASYWANN